MVIKSKLSHIKQAQRESFLRHELASFFLQIVQEDSEFVGWSITRTGLSDKRSICTLFFLCSGGQAEFDKKLPRLLSYKPGLRTLLSKTLHSRYCPELVFKYDDSQEAQAQLDAIFLALKREGKL